MKISWRYKLLEFCRETDFNSYYYYLSFFTCMIILLFKITLNHYSKKILKGFEKTVLFSVEKLKEGKIFLIIFLD